MEENKILDESITMEEIKEETPKKETKERLPKIQP